MTSYSALLWPCRKPQRIGHGIMDQLAFAALSMDFEVIAEVFMLIRIRRHDKTLQGMQGADSDRYIASVIVALTAFYVD